MKKIIILLAFALMIVLSGTCISALPAACKLGEIKVIPELEGSCDVKDSFQSTINNLKSLEENKLIKDPLEPCLWKYGLSIRLKWDEVTNMWRGELGTIGGFVYAQAATIEKTDDDGKSKRLSAIITDSLIGGLMGDANPEKTKWEGCTAKFTISSSKFSGIKVPSPQDIPGQPDTRNLGFIKNYEGNKIPWKWGEDSSGKPKPEKDTDTTWESFILGPLYRGG